MCAVDTVPGSGLAATASVRAWYSIHRKTVWVGAMYVGWVVVHACASHAYAELCAPLTLRGFVLSTVVAPAPHCVALRWAINQGATSVNGMWCWVGASIAAVMVV